MKRLRVLSARRPNQEKAAGKTLVFVPSKGGVGVTTIALNFALALTKESGAKVVVVDLDFELGEIAPGTWNDGDFLGRGRFAEPSPSRQGVSVDSSAETQFRARGTGVFRGI